jgi:PAS domain-containing protein
MTCSPGTWLIPIGGREAVDANRRPILNWEYPGRDTDGKPEWFLISKLPLRDSHGNITGMVGTNRYVTATKQAEQSQRAMSEGLRAVLDVA